MKGEWWKQTRNKDSFMFSLCDDARGQIQLLMATLQVDDLSILEVLPNFKPILFYLNVKWQCRRAFPFL